MEDFIDYTESSSGSSNGDLSNYYTKSQTSSLIDSKLLNNNSRTELEDSFKYAYSTYYKEGVETNGIITQINIWVDSGKSTKLFTKNFTRINGLVTKIELIDETNGNKLIKGFTYLDKRWVSTSCSFIGA
jgi:ribonuclease HII